MLVAAPPPASNPAAATPHTSPPNMCTTNDVQQPAGPRTDDVWDSDSAGSAPGSPLQHNQMHREWEARKHQFYNAGYREGLEEGKELTLQQGFNAGFAEGAQAGYDFGLVKGALQVLAAHLQDAQKRSKAQDLLQQVSAVNPKAAMQDSVTALAGQQPVDVIQQHLQAALVLHEGGTHDITPAQGGGSSNSAGQPAAQQAPQSPTAAGTTAAAAAGALATGLHAPLIGSSGSTAGAAELPLPMQLVVHLKAELQQLGFDVGGPPALKVTSSRTQPPVAGQPQEDQV